MKQGASTASSQAPDNLDLAKSTEKPIRILIVDAHPVARMGLKSLLAQHRHLIAIGDTSDGKDALAKAKELSPDVVLMDIRLPKLDGLAVTESLQKAQPEIKVLIVSGYSQNEFGDRIMQSGACGFISKEASPAELVQAIETVAAGAKYFRVTDTVPTGLTAREREVLVALVEGLTRRRMVEEFGDPIRRPR